MASVSTQIAGFITGARELSLSAAQLHTAKRAFFDTFAVAIAGRDEDAPRITRHCLDEVAGIGAASAWDRGTKFPAESAALLNGVMAHVLDYDDVMTPMRGHVSAALVPALVALSEQTGADALRFSAAYVVGFEVLAKFSRVMALEHYRKGWHSTSALGVIGATAACCALLELDQEQSVSALGLAVAQAAGTRQNFGTMAKAFQAGQCSAAAVRAATFARSGFTAASDALDGPNGYLALYGAREDLSQTLATLGASPLEIDAVGIDIKKYPCCYATHRALDGTLDLRREHAIAFDEVNGVDVETSAGGLEAVICSRPRSGLEAKFSMEYAIAAALHDGSIRLATFDDGQVSRPALQQFFPRITKRESAGAVLPRWVKITITLKSGEAYSRHVASARGDAVDPLSDEELIKKADDCFVYGHCPVAAREFAARVFAPANSGVADVLHAFYASEHDLGRKADRS